MADTKTDKLTPHGVYEYADFSPKSDKEWAQVKSDAATLATSLDRAAERLNATKKK
jgi:hypothetical protein